MKSIKNRNKVSRKQRKYDEKFHTSKFMILISADFFFTAKIVPRK